MPQCHKIDLFTSPAKAGPPLAKYELIIYLLKVCLIISPTPERFFLCNNVAISGLHCIGKKFKSKPNYKDI